MNYELDLATKKKGKALELLWLKLQQAVVTRFNAVPIEHRMTQTEEQVEAMCSEVAKELDLSFRRDGFWLCFTDKSLALD